MSVTEHISAVTEKIIARSKNSRARYLAKIDAAVAHQPKRKALGCANIAHGFAACGPHDKDMLRNGTEWHDLGAAHFDRADATKTANRLIRRLQQIGYQVTATPA